MTTQNWDSTQSDDNDTSPIEENFDSTEESPTNKSQSTGQNDDNTTTTGNITLQTLQSELENSKIKLAELTIISQQALADLQNFKKRTEDEKSKFVSFANANLINDLLPVLDNLNRAIEHIPENPAAKEWALGIVAIIKQMDQIFADKGLIPLDTTNQVFDPNFHEALVTQKGPADNIMKELEKGYRMGERIIRRAKVAVGDGNHHEEKKSE